MFDEPALALAARLRRRELSSVELTRHTLATIRARNAELGAFVAVDEAGALRQAARADALLARGARLPFLGIPTGIKDAEPVRGHFMRLGSRAFRWLYTPVDGFVARTCRRAGFVIVGKCATSELTILPIIDHPPTRNPLAPDHYAGGSSGGTASAIAARMIAVAPGSDGGGSIRIPASFCNLVGIKPGRGMLYNHYASYDRAAISTLGPLAHTVRDAAALLDALDGTATPQFSSRSFLAACDAPLPTRLRVRVLLSSPISRLDPEVVAATVEVARRIEALGNNLTPAPPMLGSLDDFLPIMARLVASVPVLPGTTRLLEPATRWLRAYGRPISHAEAAAAATAMSDRVLDWFADTDILVTPTVAHLPPRVGAYANLDGEATFRAAAQLGAFTAPFNVSGQPAISLPVARSRDGLPIGVQLVGRPHSDRLLLALAARLVD